MGNRLRRFLLNTAGIILVMVTGTTCIPAYAQVNPEIANCEEVQDQATLTQMEFCSAHIGCRMVLKLQKVCAKAKGFLNKLKDALSGRRDITNDDVFEANSPALMPNPTLRSQVAAVQKIVRDAANDPTNGKLEFKSAAGRQVYYEGGLKDGKRHGVGVTIESDGYAVRGQYENNLVSGQAQVVRPQGTISSGNWRDGRLSGSGVWQGSNALDGLVGVGMYDKSRNVGMWDYTEPSGITYKVLYGADGMELARGPEAPPGQIARAPGAGPATASAVAPPSQGGYAAPGSPDYQPGRSSPSAAPGSASAAPRAIAAGRSCQDVMNSLIGPVNDNAASSRLTPAQNAQESVWAMQTYLRVVNTHPACANDPQSRQQVANMLRQEQDRCRQSGSSNCVTGQNFTGTAARTEVAIRQLFQESPVAGGPVASAPSAGGNCVAAIDQQEAEFRPISQRIANTPSSVSQMQLLMGMLKKRMALLDQVCKGQPLYATYAGTQQQFDSAMRSCQGIASNPADCGPQLASAGTSAQPQQCDPRIGVIDGNGKCVGALECCRRQGYQGR